MNFITRRIIQPEKLKPTKDDMRTGDTVVSLSSTSNQRVESEQEIFTSSLTRPRRLPGEKNN